MGKSTDIRKVSQLGMSYGKAIHHLRMQILFSLLEKSGENTCFKCSGRITSCNELSIEHKEPWLDNDPALFWSLSNIAFSHRVCNRPNRPKGAFVRQRDENGNFKCSSCKMWLPENQFWKRGDGKNKSHCITCIRRKDQRRNHLSKSNTGVVVIM